MLRVGVIDDEPRSLADLVRRLIDCGQCQVVCQSTDPLKGLALIQQEMPDFVLLDIEMPGLDGISLAAALPPKTQVVFCSAYSAQAIAAFDVAAIDFILKPVDNARFQRMLERVRKRLSSPEAHDQLQSGLLTLETRRGRLIFPEAEILAIFAEADTCRVLLRGDRQVYCLRPMKILEALLRPERFARVDRSTILNIEAIRSIRVLAGSKADITLADSAEPLTLGRAAASRLQRAIAEVGLAPSNYRLLT